MPGQILFAPFPPPLLPHSLLLSVPLYRYIDDVLSLKNTKIAEYLEFIYPRELEIKETAETAASSSYLDCYLYIDNGKLTTRLYDKRDDFNFPIVNFPYIRFYRYFLRSGLWAWWAKLAYQVMLTIRGRLITPFVPGSMSVGLNILICHSFMDLWVWITALVPWLQLRWKAVSRDYGLCVVTSSINSSKHEVLKMIYCDRSNSVVRRPSCGVNSLL